MIWESWNEFFAMGGYALYVWGSIVVVFACLAGEILLLRQRGKLIRQELERARAISAMQANGKNGSRA
ncbi:MAG: heme exporter protein CcmD [Pseudomonadota bacterium]